MRAEGFLQKGHPKPGFLSFMGPNSANWLTTEVKSALTLIGLELLQWVQLRFKILASTASQVQPSLSLNLEMLSLTKRVEAKIYIEIDR